MAAAPIVFRDVLQRLRSVVFDLELECGRTGNRHIDFSSRPFFRCGAIAYRPDGEVETVLDVTLCDPGVAEGSEALWFLTRLEDFDPMLALLLGPATTDLFARLDARSCKCSVLLEPTSMLLTATYVLPGSGFAMQYGVVRDDQCAPDVVARFVRSCHSLPYVRSRAALASLAA